MNKYLNKQLKIRDENLKYDFLPSIIEIIEKPSNKLGNIILFIIVSMIITTIIWAGLFKIDIVVSAVGSTSYEEGTINLDCSCSGRISDIFIKDGSYVKKGDVILSLDSTEADNSVSQIKYNLQLLKVQREMYGKAYNSISNGSELQVDTSVYNEYSSFADTIIKEKDVYSKEIKAIESDVEKQKLKEQYTLNILQNMNSLDTKISSAELSLKDAEKK